MTKYILFYLPGLLLIISSCGINSNLMFKTGKDDKVITKDIPLAPTEAYRLAPDDKFFFTLYTDNGKRIIDLQSGAEMGVEGMTSGGAGMRMGMRNSIDYLIRPDGIVQLPIIGEVNLTGLTVMEAQDKLAELYSKTYNKPYVQLEVSNRRVIVFPGSGGEAAVVPIVNNNTTLMEAIAIAGGITDRGRAKKIKVMRKTPEGRAVYEIDLSTLDGLMYADMVVQANDYIYIQPTPQISRELFAEIAPIVSILSSALIIFSIINALN